MVQTEENEGYTMHQKLSKIDEHFLTSSTALLKSVRNPQSIKEIETMVRAEYE